MSKTFVNMHMKNFNLNDFQNLCRACMAEGDLRKLQDGHMKVLNLISNVKYSRTDELPQKICEKCESKINDIMAFALLCKRIDQTLKKYLDNLKIESLPFDIDNKLKSDEETIEFIDVNEKIDLDKNHVKEELERIKNELMRAEEDEPPAAIVPSTPHDCPSCPRSFPDKSALRCHQRVVHAATMHRCPVCGMVFAHSTELTRHKGMHGTIPCRVCNRMFLTVDNLRMHEKIHQTEKPYECLICFKTFHFLKTYLKHNAIHGAGFAFQCDVCDESFPVANSLARHKRIHRKGNCKRK